MYKNDLHAKDTDARALTCARGQGMPRRSRRRRGDPRRRLAARSMRGATAAGDDGGDDDDYDDDDASWLDWDAVGCFSFGVGGLGDFVFAGGKGEFLSFAFLRRGVCGKYEMQ